MTLPNQPQWTVDPTSRDDPISCRCHYYNPASGLSVTTSPLVVILHGAARHAQRLGIPYHQPSPDVAAAASLLHFDSYARNGSPQG